MPQQTLGDGTLSFIYPFKPYYAASGTYILRIDGNGKVLTVNGSSVALEEFRGTANQYWRVDGNTGGLTIKSTSNGWYIGRDSMNTSLVLTRNASWWKPERIGMNPINPNYIIQAYDNLDMVIGHSKGYLDLEFRSSTNTWNIWFLCTYVP